MQQQAGRGAPRGGVRIQWIAQDGMSQGLQMDPELVAAPGHRSQQQPAAVRGGVVSQQRPAGEGRPAPRPVHHLARPVRPVRRQRQVDHAPGSRRPAAHHRQVVLLHPAPLERPTQARLRLGVQGEDQQPGGVHVQAMHHPRPGMTLLHPVQQAVLVPLAAAGHAEQPRRLVHHQQMAVAEADPRHASARRTVEDRLHHLSPPGAAPHSRRRAPRSPPAR